MTIKIDVRGIDKLQAFLRALPRGTIRAAIAAATEYIIGDERHGLKHAPPYKYISRAKAYGKTFVSDAQRRYVMAAIRRGEITPGKANRTGLSAAGWYSRSTSSGYAMHIRNETAGAYFTQDDENQARQPKLAGWRKAATVIKTNMRGAFRAANQAVDRWIKDNRK